MVNKIFVFCFFILLFMMAQCKSNLQTAEFDDGDDDQLFNETMADVVLMTDEVDDLINALSTVTLSDNYEKIVSHIAFIPVATLVVVVAALAANVASSAYNIWRNEKNADAAEQDKITKDERYKKLMEENERLTAEVSRIDDAVDNTANSIIAKLDQVIATMIQQDFNTKVKEKMVALMNKYKTCINVLSDLTITMFNDACGTYNVDDIISTMTSQTDEMYKEQLKKSVLDEGYNLLSQLEDGYLVQYGVLYPFCTILANGPVDNATLQSIMNVTLDTAMKPRKDANDQRNQVVWSEQSWGVGEFDLSNLLPGIPTSQEFADAIYGFMVNNLANLKEPTTYSNYSYLVLATGQSKLDITGELNLNYKEMSFSRFNGFIKSVFIYGQEKRKDPVLQCDFVPNDDGTLSSELKTELCDTYTQVNGILNFVKKHCSTYKTVIIHSYTCQTPDTADICKIAHSADEEYKVIQETCKTDPNQEVENEYIYVVYS